MITRTGGEASISIVMRVMHGTLNGNGRLYVWSMLMKRLSYALHELFKISSNLLKNI